MATAKTIYGQAFIAEDSLVQDILLLTDKGCSENTVVIIENIWDDLKSTSGTYKTNNKGYWYWEVEQSDTEDTDRKVKVKISCPKPDPEVFDYNFDEEDGDSDWTAYWKAKMKGVQENLYNSSNGLQSKELTLPGTKWINQNGDLVETQEIKYTRDDLGDIQNLLFNLY